MNKLITARRAIDIPGLGSWDLVTGRRTSAPKYAKSPYAFACMQIRGQELANVPWHIKRGDKILDSHPLIDMLLDFGPESNYVEAMLSTEIDLLSTGAGIWLHDADLLKRINPGTIEVLKNKDGITGFKQMIDGKHVNTFKRDEIVYFREYNPDDDLDFGIPILEVCKKSINAEVEALLMVEAYFKNDAIPGFILTTDQDVSEQEAGRVLKWWEARFRGSRNKGKVGVAGRGLKPISVGS